jgi:pilus assembly protein Flp/PilA
MNLLRAFFGDKRGATAIEYGLLAALISVALIAGLGTFGNSLQATFNTIGNNVTSP